MNERYNALSKRLEDLEEQIDTYEIDPDDYINEYNELLDEFNEITINGMSYDASRILEETDPTAYRCGLVDYVDTIDLGDIEEYRDLVDERDSIQDAMYEIELNERRRPS